MALHIIEHFNCIFFKFTVETVQNNSAQKLSGLRTENQTFKHHKNQLIVFGLPFLPYVAVIVFDLNVSKSLAEVPRVTGNTNLPSVVDHWL